VRKLDPAEVYRIGILVNARSVMQHVSRLMVMFDNVLCYGIGVELDNSLTNQLAVSQVADWSPCRLVNSPKCLMENLVYTISLMCDFQQIILDRYYNEIGDLRISTIKIAIMRSCLVIGQLGCSNNPLCMIS